MLIQFSQPHLIPAQGHPESWGLAVGSWEGGWQAVGGPDWVLDMA
jgi:hypothetical protein